MRRISSSTLFRQHTAAEMEIPADLVTLLQNLTTDAGWEALILSYENYSAYILDERLRAFWQTKLDAMLPAITDISPEGQLEDQRHPFFILAGRFCSHKGWFSIPKAEEANREWLGRGVTLFQDYLCCDRLVSLLQSDKDPNHATKILELTRKVKDPFGSLGAGLYAEACFRIGLYLRACDDRSERSHSLIFSFMQSAYSYMHAAIVLTPQTELLRKLTLCRFSYSSKYEGRFFSQKLKADEQHQTNTCWERRDTTYEATLEAIKSHTMDYAPPQISF